VTLSLALMQASAIGHAQQAADGTTACQLAAQDAEAQQSQGEPATDPKSGTGRATSPPPDRVDGVDDRILGVVPNFGTVKNAPNVPPITRTQTLRLAALDSFDPYVFAFVGVVAGQAQLQHQNPSFGTGASGYLKQYVTSFTDNTVGNFLTEAILPITFGLDARYFQEGAGSVLHRFGYAVSRTVVGRDLHGHRRFNIAEIGGNGIAAGLSNLYHPAADRSVSATLTLWATQVMWDTIGSVAKEFWPDIHARLHLHRPEP
jgi:hypothetical protein